jgi:hypothetical protein
MKSILNIRTIFGALMIAAVLLSGLIISIILVRAFRSPVTGEENAVALTVLPAPTSTPRGGSPTSQPPSPTSVILPAIAADQIAVGTFVQISGTGGDGLHLRPTPGLDNQPLFLGYDAEVFQVTDGPQEVDNHTWWYLTALYDQERAGWASSEYLTIIPQP